MPLPDGVSVVPVTYDTASFEVTLSGSVEDADLDALKAEFESALCAGIEDCSVAIKIVSGSFEITVELTAPATTSDGTSGGVAAAADAFVANPPAEMGGSSVEGVTDPVVTQATKDVAVAPPPPPSVPPPSPPSPPLTPGSKTYEELQEMINALRAENNELREELDELSESCSTEQCLGCYDRDGQRIANGDFNGVSGFTLGDAIYVAGAWAQRNVFPWEPVDKWDQ